MEGKGSLFITLGSHKYPWFHTLPLLYTLLKEKLRNIHRIKILTLSAAHNDKCVDVSPRIHSVFCNKSSRHQGFDKMQLNQRDT
jgi:hypothetical protein